MDLLDNFLLFANPLRDWLTALGIALAINLLVGALKWAITRRLARLLPRTSEDLDRSVIVVARRTRQWLVFFVTLFIGSRYLELPARVDTVLQGAATVAASEAVVARGDQVQR